MKLILTDIFTTIENMKLTKYTTLFLDFHSACSFQKISLFTAAAESVLKDTKKMILTSGT